MFRALCISNTFKCLLQTENSKTGGAYVHGRSADTNLAEIHEEMSELLDKQVNVQNESLKILPGFMQASTSPRKKCVIKMKERKKMTTA